MRLNCMYRFLLVLLALGSMAVAADRPLAYQATIYIEDMPGDLDTYIRAEILNKNVPLRIVMKPEQASYIMTGEATDKEKRKWHEGFLTAGRRDLTTGTIQVIERESGELVMAEAVGDGGSNWKLQVGKRGNARLAQKLASRLKKATRKK